MERNVSLSTFIDLLKEKKRHFYMGGIFSLLSIFVMFPMLLFIMHGSKEPYENYNTEEILSKGTPAKAIIKHLKVIENVSMNNQHPVEINYVYEVNGNQVRDKFQTLDLEKVYDLKEGSSVNIKTYNNQSVITDLESFSFPFGFFYFFPLMFLVPGLIIFSIALIPALKKRKLYQKGILTDAHFIGMSLFSTTPLANERMANVDYYYMKNGRQIFGTSTTNEFLPLAVKTKEDIIKIFVDPNDENKSCYISKLAALKNNWNIKFD